MTYPVSKLVFPVLRSAGLVDVVDAFPFHATLVELDEDGVMGVRHTNAALSLVDDPLKCFECGLRVNDHRHTLAKELFPNELLVSVVRKEIRAALGDFTDA